MDILELLSCIVDDLSSLYLYGEYFHVERYCLSL